MDFSLQDANLKTAADVVRTDLDYILAGADSELNTMAGATLLLTGGAGFLGYYLVQSVLAWNDRHSPADAIRLTVVDNFARGRPEWLARLPDGPAFRCVRHNITEPLPAHIGAADYTIHAASIASPTYYRQHPIETMDANVNGLRLLLDGARERQGRAAPIRGFLFLSSSEIYGNPSRDAIPTPEDYWGHVSCTGPRACYDESKRYGETLSVNFSRIHGLPIRIARPFNNYGPGLKISDGRVLPDLVRNMLRGQDLALFSDGRPTRTFCYVADAAIGYLKVLVRGGNGEAYNVGVEEPEISMLDLARKVAEIGKRELGYRGQVVFARNTDSAYLTDNPDRRCPTIAKAREVLGYRPGIGLDEGLLRSILWYREQPVAEEGS